MLEKEGKVSEVLTLRGAGYVDEERYDVICASYVKAALGEAPEMIRLTVMSPHHWVTTQPTDVIPTWEVEWLEDAGALRVRILCGKIPIPVFSGVINAGDIDGFVSTAIHDELRHWLSKCAAPGDIVYVRVEKAEAF